MPQLNVRAISVGVTVRSHSQPNTGGIGQEFASRRALQSSGKTRGRFSGNPPPVICANALTGVARAADGELDPSALLRAADVAMYEVKHRGKGGVQVADDPRAPGRSAAIRWARSSPRSRRSPWTWSASPTCRRR